MPWSWFDSWSRSDSRWTDGGAFRRSAVGFLVVYCFLLLCIPSQLIIGPLGSTGTPANLWGLVALMWWLFATIGGFNKAPRTTRVKIAMFALTLAALASYSLAMTRGWYAPVGLGQSTDTITDIVPATGQIISEKSILAADRGLLTLASWLGIVLLTSDGLSGWDDLQRLTKWLVWFAGVVAAVGILQFFTDLNIASYLRIPGLVANADFGLTATRSVVRRVSSTAVHPIEFGVVMAGIFPLALHVAITNWPRKVMWIPAVLLAIAIPMSVSRSAVLALLVALVLLVISWPNAWRIRALIIAPVAAVIFRLMIPGLLGTILSLFTNLGNDPSVSGRTDDYGVVFNLAFDSPLLGRGLYTFLPQYYRTLDNQYLLTFVELGVLGLIAFVCVCVAAYSASRSARKRTADLGQKNLALSIGAGLSGVVVSYATFDAWGFPMASGLTFFLVGMAGAAWAAAQRETRGPTQILDETPSAPGGSR